jgi:hypothetical protein
MWMADSSDQSAICIPPLAIAFFISVQNEEKTGREGTKIHQGNLGVASCLRAFVARG